MERNATRTSEIKQYPCTPISCQREKLFKKVTINLNIFHSIFPQPSIPPRCSKIHNGFIGKDSSTAKITITAALGVHVQQMNRVILKKYLTYFADDDIYFLGTSK